MSPIDQSIALLAGVLLAAVFGYAFWVKVRGLLLKAEILEVYADLRDVGKRYGAFAEPAYLYQRHVLDSFSCFADDLSFPFMACMIYEASRDKSESGIPVAQNPDLQKAIMANRAKVVSLVMHHITNRTISGGLFWLLMRTVPRKVAKAEVSEAVEISAKPIFSRRSFVRSC